MSELVAQDTFVLLYECYNNESLYGGGDNVVLKFLPNKHPFARLLLHDQKTRKRKMKVAYELDLWRSSDPVIDWDDDESVYARSWHHPIKYCRQSVIWSSEYGRPLEAHLNLCRSVETWLKTQPVATFGRDGFPKTVIGMVRLDSDEHCYTDIQRDIIDNENERLKYAYNDDGVIMKETVRTQLPKRNWMMKHLMRITVLSGFMYVGI